MHGHRTGLQRGSIGPMVCAMLGQADTEDREGTKPKYFQTTNASTPAPDTRTENTSINAVTRGGKKGEQGQNKGYG